MFTGVGLRYIASLDRVIQASLCPHLLRVALPVRAISAFDGRGVLGLRAFVDGAQALWIALSVEPLA